MASALAFCLAAGILFTAGACWASHSGWPMLSVVLSLLTLSVLFCTNLLDSVLLDAALPAELEDNADYDVGWFIVGALLTSSLFSPLLLAHTEKVSMFASWLSCAGSVCITGTVGLLGIFFAKGKLADMGLG